MPRPPIDFTSAYSHNGDHAFMVNLGLRADGYALHEWTDLGTVIVEEADPEGEYGPRPSTSVRVEVYAAPAQFYRFTILRPRDDIETLPDGTVRAIYESRERMVLTTGTGGFQEFWAAAVLLAGNMLGVTEWGSETPEEGPAA